MMVTALTLYKRNEIERNIIKILHKGPRVPKKEHSALNLVFGALFLQKTPFITIFFVQKLTNKEFNLVNKKVFKNIKNISRSITH